MLPIEKALMIGFSLSGLLVGCKSAPEPKANAPAKEAAHAMPAHDKGGAGHDMETLPVEKRVAFMSGHVEAGLALYRAGAPDQAAKHLLHPVSETHQAERAGIDALGFTADVFEAVSKALDEGRAAAEIEPMLKQCEANMALMQKNAGGDSKVIIAYLMDTVDEEYAIGVKEGTITDPGEYQDAFGFTVVAHKIAKRLTKVKQNHYSFSQASALVTALEALHATWPKGGPLADSTPTAVDTVKGLTGKVREALSALP